MNAFELRKAAGAEEVDYVTLMSLLAPYANPRDKISRLLKAGHLVRVKKGLYVFGEAVAQRPFVKETLANRIYGPSAISLQYALSYYGLIPERVVEITSITSKRTRRFHTPVGAFSYRHLHPAAYAAGIVLQPLDESHTVLMATREKALADMLALAVPRPGLENEGELEEYLSEDLRLEPGAVAALKPSLVRRLAECYRHPNVSLLAKLVRKEARP